MCNTCITVNASARYDPTKTTTLRRGFEAEAVRRFRRLKRQIRAVIVDDDAFGLRAVRANAGAFDFPRSADKVSAFMAWLVEQQQRGILDVTSGAALSMAADQAWSSVYIRSAYQRGMAQAAAEMRGQGASVAPEWVVEAFTRPVNADRVGLIYTRTFSDLKGITDVMDQQISRILSDGISSGSGVMDIANAVIDRVEKVGVTRARMLARTEVIRAHAEASLNTYEEAGVQGIGIKAEFRTAGDSKVCPECAAAAANGPYTIDAARGMIPLHPNCRCAMIPIVENPREVNLR